MFRFFFSLIFVFISAGFLAVAFVSNGVCFAKLLYCQNGTIVYHIKHNTICRVSYNASKYNELTYCLNSY